jgi:hypothetical protein
MKRLLPLLAVALLAAPVTSKADVQDRLYDFTDAYYLANGVNPASTTYVSKPLDPGWLPWLGVVVRFVYG